MSVSVILNEKDIFVAATSNIDCLCTMLLINNKKKVHMGSTWNR